MHGLRDVSVKTADVSRRLWMADRILRIVIEALLSGNHQVEQDVKRLAVYDKTLPNTPQQLCNQLFHTVYMGM